MINKILCVSRASANRMKESILENNIDGYDNVFCISIHGTPFVDGEMEGSELFSFEERCDTRIVHYTSKVTGLDSYIERIISLEFDDVCPDTVVRIINESKFMDRDQAIFIIEHVLAWHGIDGNNLLIVHCAAGICRSGSISRFCSYLFNIEPDTIKTNPQMLYNNWVTYLLYATYSEVT